MAGGRGRAEDAGLRAVVAEHALGADAVLVDVEPVLADEGLRAAALAAGGGSRGGGRVRGQSRRTARAGRRRQGHVRGNKFEACAFDVKKASLPRPIQNIK